MVNITSYLHKIDNFHGFQCLKYDIFNPPFSPVTRTGDQVLHQYHKFRPEILYF